LHAAAAADWETEDFDGKRHRLADYRGKVVILEFWYRGCPFCVRSMPQQKYRNKGVVVLGMNIDEDDEGARSVIKQMALNYPNLKALPGKIWAVYNAKSLGYPVLYVLDQNGRVVDIHTGYSPQLAQRVGAVVEKLLQKTASDAGSTRSR
jgi:peroxiredoxin